MEAHSVLGLVSGLLGAGKLAQIWQVGGVLLNAPLDVLADVLGILGQVQVCMQQAGSAHNTELC